jgi:hypothetical protein
MPRTPPPELQMRSTVSGPPPGVAMRMQRDRFDLVDAIASDADALVFAFTVAVADAQSSPPRFTGAFTQGPADKRFVYVNVGTAAGQRDSPWSRRIKVPLYSIAPELVAEALARPGSVLSAAIRGTGRDGTPACATVPLASPWTVALA